MYFNKNIVCLLLVTVTLFSITHADMEFQKNRVLEYAFKQLSYSKIDNKDNYLLAIARFSIKFEYSDNAIRIFKLISDEYYKYSLLIDLLSNWQRLSEVNFNMVTGMIDKINDKFCRISILYFMTLGYIQKKDTINVIATLKKLRKMNDLINDSGYLAIMNLVEPLSKLGLIEEAEKILKDYEDFAFNKDKKFIFMKEIFRKYHTLNRGKKITEFTSKIEEYINSVKDIEKKIQRSIEFSQFLFQIENFKLAEWHIKKTYEYCNKILDQNTKMKCFVELLKSGESIFISDSLRSLPGLEKSLIQNIVLDKNKLKNNSWADVFNREVIKFLVRKGKYTKAREIADKLDVENEKQSRNDVSLYKDYYYYYLGEKCLKSNETKIRSKALNVAERIQQHMMLKIELLLDIAESYDNDEPNGQALEIVNLASQILIKDKWERDEALGKIVMFCIKAGYYKMALKIIERVDYHRTRSALIFEAAQTNIRECNVHLAKQLINRYQPDITFKAYIVSKIAAKLMVDGKKNEAEEMFKKAIDLILAANSGSLEVILKDYFYARKYGRLTRYNAWERLHVIE